MPEQWRSARSWIWCRTRSAERGPCRSPSSPEQSNRSRIPGGTSTGGDGTDQETVGGELGTSRSMTARQRKRLLRTIRRLKSHVGNGMRPSWILRDSKTSRYSMWISVRPQRRKCMQLYSTLLSTHEEEPCDNTLTKKSHTSACRYSMLPVFQFSRGPYILYSDYCPLRIIKRLSGFWTRSNGSQVCLS